MVIMKPLSLILAATLGLVMAANSAIAETLLANSFCVSCPTSDLEFGKNSGVTSVGETRIKLLVFSPEEERDIANVTDLHMAKTGCLALAEEDGYVAFTIEGVDRYFATSPLNIVKRSPVITQPHMPIAVTVAVATPTPFFLTPEMQARIDADRKAAALRARQDAADKAKWHAFKFKNGE